MKNLPCLLIVLISLSLYSQPKELKGFWILERTVYENGDFLEINNPIYSSFVSLEFKKNSVKINDKSFKAEYFKDSMKVGFRDITYIFQDDYLLLQDKGDDKINIYSKYEDYIEKHPEFISEIEVVNNDSILISNEVIKPLFNHELTFEDFLRKNIGEYSKQQSKNFFFKASFILTKDNKLKDIQIIQGISKKFDKQFVETLTETEKYLKNKTNYDIVLKHTFNFVKMHNYYNSENAKLFNEVHKKAKEYFESNQFEKVIIEYSKFDFSLLADQKDRFQYEINKAYRNLGISFLVLNEKKKACEAFTNVGDKTNFFVRNYLIDFCEN